MILRMQAALASPELLGAANGQYDNNSTLMLSFDTAVSGEGTAVNCGNLRVTLTRDSDGYEYNLLRTALLYKMIYLLLEAVLIMFLIPQKILGIKEEYR